LKSDYNYDPKDNLLQGRSFGIVWL